MMDTTSILKKLYNELTKAHFEEDKALLLRKFLDLSDQKMFGEDIPETTLLKISFLRKFLTVSDTIDLNVLSQIWEGLFDCLKANNQFVIFSASKALVSLLKRLPKEALLEKIQIIIDTFNSSVESTYVAIYTLQTIAELLREFRKDPHKSSIKIECCLESVCLQWESIMIGLRCTCSHLVLGQCLLLSVECLRCMTQSCKKNHLSVFVHFHTLLMTMSIESPSLWCRSKILSLSSKILTISVEPLELNAVEGFQCFAESILRKWFIRESVIVYDSFIIEYYASLSNKNDIIIDQSQEVTHMERIFLRKYFLLALQLASFSVSPLLVCSLLSKFVSSLRRLVSEMFYIPGELMIIFLNKLVLHCVAEDDGCLVTTLNSYCKISMITEVLPNIIIEAIDIHRFFLLFIISIGFDVSAVLDLVISSETDFDYFLLQYLQLISSDTGGSKLTFICEQIDALSTNNESESPHKLGNVEINNTGDGNKVLDKLLNCLSGLYTQLDSAVNKRLLSEGKESVISKILMEIETMA